MIYALIDFFSIFSGHQYLILFPDFNRRIPMGCPTLISIGSFTERKSLRDCKLHAAGMAVR